MKRFISCFVVLFLSAGALMLKAGEYADAKPVLEKMGHVMEVFINALDKAQTAPEVAAALDAHSKSMLALAPKLKEIGQKYPELNDPDFPTPDALKPLEEKIELLAQKLAPLYGKIGQYAEEPEVKAAFERWQKAMATAHGEEDESQDEDEG